MSLCLRCGAVLEPRPDGPRAKWCSDTCRYPHLASATVRCQGCPAEIVVGPLSNGRLWCDRCRKIRRAAVQRQNAQRRRPCPLGRATKVLHWDDPVRAKWRRTLRVRRCAGCPAAVGRKFAKWCSEACYNRHGRPVREGATAIAYGACLECGRLFVRRAGQLGSYCSQGHAKRAEKRTRRHRLRTNGPAEHFTLREIGDRDGWRCHLCGRKVNPTLDPQHARAGSIDHLIPVSDDGLHLRENVALAHRECNWERRAGGSVQLRLVG